MKNIAPLDNAANAGKSLKEQGIDRNFYRAYKDTQKAGLNMLNFFEEIKIDEIADVIAACKKFGVAEFTLSDHATCGIERLSDFQKAGCKVTGLMEVTREELDGNCEFVTKTIPAIIMQVL